LQNTEGTCSRHCATLENRIQNSVFCILLIIFVVNAFLRSLGIDPPQGKGSTRFETGIYAINQVKTPIVARADERFFLTEGQRIERAPEFPKHDLNDDQIFVALFIDGENFR
jgi:hypothetical protein